MKFKPRENWRVINQFYLKYRKKLFLVLALCFFILLYIQIQAGIQYSKQLDNYFSVLYSREIFPKGEQRIHGILDEIQNVSDDQEKLDKIGEWETIDFTEYYWEKGYKNNTQFEFTSLDSPINRYYYDNNGKIRAFSSLFGANLYANDPSWIAYYRTGACGELTYLFANVSNRSGFETRVVGAELKSPFPFPVLDGISFFDIVTGNHAWVEVKIKNEWWYYDPDTFGQYYNFGKMTQKNGWFNQTKYYSAFRPRQVGKVFLIINNEDIKDRYPLLGGP